MTTGRYLGVAAWLAVAALTLGWAANSAADPTFSIDSTVASPNPVARGSSTTITTAVTATGAPASILVDLEIYNASGTRVNQQVTWADLAGGEQRTFQWTWSVPASLATGTYTVKFGVFSNDWGILYLWENAATSIAVNTGGGGTFTLAVAKAGSGTGTVTSAPSGISCGTDCSEAYSPSTSVTLTATPAGGSTFAGWSGGGCSGTATTCTVTMSVNRTVTATFAASGGPPNFVVQTTSATPSPMARGASTTVTTSIVNTGGAVSGVLIDMGIWNAGGTRVNQQVTMGQTFQAGEQKSFQWTWAVPANQPLGTYRISMGVFGPNWSVLYVWVDTAATLTVQSTPTFTLTVSRTGSGTVTSSPAGINCGTDCSEAYAGNTAVTLTAAPASGWTFGGWTGGGCSGTGGCTVTVTAATTVTATFQQGPVTLTVARGGNGTGTVTSAPAGIACGADCSEAYPPGTAVTLTAAAGSGSAFAGWSGGGCSGTGGCTVTVTAATTVTATFQQWVTLTMVRGGTGTGTVAGAPAGIACGADCSEAYPPGTAVTLTAAAGSGSAFAGWSGGGCSGTGTCTVTVSAATTVTATFTLGGLFTLTAGRAGSGSGSVSSAPAGIACGTDCTEPYASGTSVTLTATPNAGSAFTGWSGGGCSGTGSCTVMVSADTTVIATFNATAANPIVAENQRPGSGGWRLDGPVADDYSKQIKGYASATSVAPGGTIGFHVTVSPAQSYTIDIFRIGWYGGVGGRLMRRIGPLAGTEQPDCPRDEATGLIACAWTVGSTLTVPTDWTTGVYVGVLTNADGWQSYLIFAVRDDGRVGALLFQQSVNTYQAYNNFPDDGSTGKSLYGYNSYGGIIVGGETRAAKVSFDRPYTDGAGAGQFFHWELHLIRWLERSGYDVTYSTDVDTHASGARLLTSRAFLSVGHDEYWSKAMRDAVESARDAGVSLGFFGANAAYWQVRFEASASGVPNRVMVCYKDAGADPVSGPQATIRFRDPALNRAEQALIGIQYTSYVQWGLNVPYVVVNSGHPIYTGTGFQDGDSVPGLVGYEMDRFMSEYPRPPGATPTILSQSPFIDINGNFDTSNAAIYQAPSGAWVFAAGTICWAWALDDLDEAVSDPRILRLTANVIDTFVRGTLPGP
jgi:hypothetical protein